MFDRLPKMNISSPPTHFVQSTGTAPLNRFAKPTRTVTPVNNRASIYCRFYTSTNIPDIHHASHYIRPRTLALLARDWTNGCGPEAQLLAPGVACRGKETQEKSEIHVGL